MKISGCVTCAIAGIFCGMVFSARSEITGWINHPETPACGQLAQAAQEAVNNKVQVIGMTSPDPGKYFNTGSPDSCLGDMSIANIDLSKLIPDPLGLMSSGVDSVIDALKKSAMAAGCAAVRGSIAETISKYNGALSSTDIRGGTNNYIDSAIGNTSRQALNGYAMNWRTPTASGVQLPNTPVVLPAETTPIVPIPAPATPSEKKGLGAAIFGQ